MWSLLSPGQQCRPDVWRLWLLLVAFGGLFYALTTPALAAPAEPSDVSGSRDPYDLERIPRSRIVEYQRDTEVRSREFIMGRVDSVRRDLRIGDQLDVEATQESVTYQAPEGASVDGVFDHYLQQIGADVLFRCEARGCGRSNDWANRVFEQAILYGPDRHQRYAALEWQGRLIGLYVIERGNRRIYAHLQILEPEGHNAMQLNALMVRRLSERGWAPIEGVQPDDDGSFDAAARQVLTGLAANLEAFAGESMYVICHMYATRPVAGLLEVAQRCAESSVDLIVAGADAQDGVATPEMQPFAAGPLLPRSMYPGARLELVLPERVSARNRP
jgi:hypothetical protein